MATHREMLTMAILATRISTLKDQKKKDQNKGPKSQTPPLMQLRTNIGNCIIIMHKSEKAKLTTHMLAGVLKSGVLVKRCRTKEFPIKKRHFLY